MIAAIWRFVADAVLIAVFYLGWIFLTLWAIDGLGWNADLMGILALVPAVLVVVVHVFAQGFFHGYERSRKP